MIVERSEHESYLSNTWLVADKPGGNAVFIDTGAPIEPLLKVINERSLTVTHIFNTHEHHDHTIHNVELQERFGAPLLTPDDLEDGATIHSGDLSIVARSTPGHTPRHLAFLVNNEALFTGDALFRESVGGTMAAGPAGCATLRHTIMNVLMQMDPGTVVYPGHTEVTTIGHEWDHNPFVRYWRNLDESHGIDVQVTGRPATILVEATDYDGGRKALVRFDDGHEAIVGGSMIERSPASV